MPEHSAIDHLALVTNAMEEGAGFQSKVPSDISNVTGNGTSYSFAAASHTEITDRGSNLSNGTFTAPDTGLYLITGVLSLAGLTSSHSFTVAQIVTSNRTYACLAVGDIRTGLGSVQMAFAIIADMDAGDTAYMTYQIAGGTKVVDVESDWHFFAGYFLR